MNPPRCAVCKKPLYVSEFLILDTGDDHWRRMWMCPKHKERAPAFRARANREEDTAEQEIEVTYAEAYL